jgi:hypothetical protein
VPNKTRQIKGWDTFQHYKTGPHAKNAPEWIKLYPRLLNDMEWHKLTDTDKAVLTELWMLASEKGGCLPQLEEIAFRLRRPIDQITMVLNRLPNWIENAAVSEPYRQPLDEVYTPSSPEEKRIQDTRDKIEERRGARAPAAKEDYSFSGNVVRLNHKDHASWRASFSFLDLDAELVARDAWLSEDRSREKNWFGSTSKYLANRNAEAKAKVERPPPAERVSPKMRGALAELRECEERENAASDNKRLNGPTGGFGDSPDREAGGVSCGGIIGELSAEEL